MASEHGRVRRRRWTRTWKWWPLALAFAEDARGASCEGATSSCSDDVRAGTLADEDGTGHCTCLATESIEDWCAEMRLLAGGGCPTFTQYLAALDDAEVPEIYVCTGNDGQTLHLVTYSYPVIDGPSQGPSVFFADGSMVGARETAEFGCPGCPQTAEPTFCCAGSLAWSVTWGEVGEDCVLSTQDTGAAIEPPPSPGSSGGCRCGVDPRGGSPSLVLASMAAAVACFRRMDPRGGPSRARRRSDVAPVRIRRYHETTGG